MRVELDMLMINNQAPKPSDLNLYHQNLGVFVAGIPYQFLDLISFPKSGQPGQLVSNLID